jgi:hypothetical protein
MARPERYAVQRRVEKHLLRRGDCAKQLPIARLGTIPQALGDCLQESVAVAHVQRLSRAKDLIELVVGQSKHDGGASLDSNIDARTIRTHASSFSCG